MNRSKELKDAVEQTEMANKKIKMQGNSGKSSFSWGKWLLMPLLLLVVGITGFYAVTNPQVFRAAITEVAVPTGGSQLYMPTYTADPVDTGNLAIKVRPSATAENIHSVQFRLKYNPVNALTFNSNSIVFDGDTLFQSADLKSVNTSVPGEVFVTFFSNTPVSVAGAVNPNPDPVLVKLQANVSGSAGTDIQFTMEDVEVIHAPTAGSFEVSTQHTGIDVDKMSLVTGDSLRVLNAEAIDSTHVLVQFSDLLQSVGSSSDYTIPGLTVSAAQNGSISGFGQDSVVLLTSSQTAGNLYTLTVASGNVQSNSQGTVDSNYGQVPFAGFGDGGGTLSDFNVTGAQATDYDTLQLSFSDPVATASVNTSGFTVSGMTVLDATASGSNVTLTVDGPLLSDTTYNVTVQATVKRESDNAVLGVNQVATQGYANGPKLVSITAQDGFVNLTFDTNIAATGDIGTIQETGLIAGGTVINAASYTIGGNQLSINPFNSVAETNYTFVANASLVDAVNGLPLDPNFNRLSFWGFDTTSGNAAIGAAQITRKNVVEVDPGTTGLDYNLLTTADVEVFEYVAANNKANLAVTAVSVTTDNKLKVITGTDFEPGKKYFVRVGNPSLGVASFKLESDLVLTGAQANAANQVMVSFSENLDQNTVSAGQFTLSPAIAVTAADVQAGFQQVLLTLGGSMNPGTVYRVTAQDGTAGVRTFFGGKTMGLNTAAFTGFQTQTAQSSVQLDSIDVLSSTQIMLHFSGALDAATVTPINIDISNAAGASLTVNGVVVNDAQTVTVSTDTQAADENYFVTFNGVTDTSGLRIGNSRILNFFGFTAPSVQVNGVTPNNVTNEADQAVVLLGQNLDAIATVQLSGSTLEISQQNTGALTVNVPAGLAAGVYNLTLIMADGSSQVLASALTINNAEQPLRVVSEQSRSIPNRVPPDGTTDVTFWVLVEDPLDIANIDTVTIDLEPIGGSRAQPMTPDTGIQPQFQQFYTYTTTISPLTPTQADPYLLNVEVRKGSEVAQGTVSVTVTQDVLQSVAPIFDQVYVNPVTVAPDGVTPVTISAKISDPDGADTVTSVVADLGALGVGFKPMTQIDVSGAANELTTGWFASEEFVIPATTRQGDYTVNLTASDDTGEVTEHQLTITVSSELNGPFVDGNKSYIAPQRSVPKDGQTPFSIHVMVSDPDGVSDIGSVLAYMPTLGITPVPLTIDPSASDAARTALFSSEGVVIPTTAAFGIHEIEIIATDSSGGTGSSILRIDAAQRDIIGDAPLIFTDRSYTTPNIAVNDGQTGVTLYAFVRDDDDDLDSVVVNLSNIGQVGPQLAPDFGEVDGGVPTPAAPVLGDGSCPTNSNVIVCMEPSFKEGADGQWFVLPDVTVSPRTLAKDEPYEIEVIATDLSGKTTRGTLELTVRDSDTFVDDRNPPSILAAVPVSPGRIEVVLSEEINLNTVKSSGSQFTITEESDVSKSLGVLGATVNATGTVVTLTTDTQNQNRRYVLNGSSEIKDSTGIGLVTGSRGRAFFEGFVQSQKPPVVNFIGATSLDTLEIEFQEPVRPTSLRIGETANPSGGDFDVKVYKADASNEPLAVYAMRFVESGKTLEVITAPHLSNQRYRVEIENVASAAGIELERPITKFFKAINLRALQEVAVSNQADLNRDGRVDFTDFTMFSAVYGKVFDQAGTPVESIPTGGPSPIQPTPDATVPITSQPTGQPALPQN